MALHARNASGFSSMLKDGARTYSDWEKIVYGNITACEEFADSLRSAYGQLYREAVCHIRCLTYHS